MYGWIHECLKVMIINYYSEEIWNEIIKKAGEEKYQWKDVEEYISDNNFFYLHSITANIIGINEIQLCEMYGKYFLTYVRQQGHERLLRCLGNNLFDWLANVNQVHTHLLYTMNQMKPPYIWCEKIKGSDDSTFLLHYQSVRGTKLLPLMVGIVTTVAKDYFGKIVSLELIQTQDETNSNSSTCWKVIEIDDISSNDSVNDHDNNDDHENNDNNNNNNNNFDQDDDYNDHNFSESDCSNSITIHDAIIEIDSLDENCYKSSDDKYPYNNNNNNNATTTTTTKLKNLLNESNTSTLMNACPITIPKLSLSNISSLPNSLQISLNDILPHDLTRQDSNKLKLDFSSFNNNNNNSNNNNSYDSYSNNNSTNSTPRLTENISPRGYSKSLSSLSTPNCPSCHQKFKNKTSSTHYGLSYTQLHRLFPCHIIFDSNYRIIQVGPKISQLLSNVIIGNYVNTLFEIKNHNITWGKNWKDLEAILSSKPQFVVQAYEKSSKTNQSLSLSGPISFSDDGKYATFLCAPDIKTLAELYDFNLTMNDIAIYGCRLQMVLQEDHLYHTQETNNKLTELTKQIKCEQQKRLQLMEEIANKANEALAIKQTFVRYVSHEIRTPLSVAKLGLLLLDEELAQINDNIEQKVRNHIKECQDSLDIAVNILNDLLCYEKLESGVFELDKEICPAVDFIENSLDLFSIQAKQKEIDLIFQNHLSPKYSKNLKFDIDTKKMSQVIRNFVSNALKFTPIKGNVCVSVNYSSNSEELDKKCLSQSKTIIDKQTNEEYSLSGILTIGFKDNGVGVEKEHQSKLFNEIIQFSPNALQNGGGSGLGLWISKSIVERHCGSVGMHSEGLGCGSTFYMKLPVYSINQLFHNNLESLPSPLTSNNNSPSIFGIKNLSIEINNSNENSSIEDEKIHTPEELSEEIKRKKLFLGLKVLIVDDAAMIRKLMTKLLSSKGSICDTAEDGLFAVDIMKKYYNETSLLNCNDKNYDIIFMDFMMPNMDGPQATREIRALGYKGLIIGVTGNMMPTDVDYFMNSGADTILPKPLSIQMLQDYLMTKLH